MSPLWRDQIRVCLSPRQVTLLRLTRGWTPRIAGMRIVSCDATRTGDAPWRGAMAALETALPEFGERKADAVVVLSNHFVRYTLVMQDSQINTAEEEQALVHHCFARIYGDATDHWMFRLSDADGDNAPRVASAVDRELWELLRALFQSTKLTLCSIQPLLMASFNQWRHQFKESAWLALVEPDRLCLARFQNNRWHSIRSAPIGDDWFRDFTVQLDRERLLLPSDAPDTATKEPVFVFAPGLPEPQAAQIEEHAVQLLRASFPPGGQEPVEAPYAMALAG